MNGRRLAAIGAILIGMAAVAYAHLPKIWVAREERLARPQGLVFTGALPTYADDCFTYWSWMRQSRNGAFFLTDLYTTEEHPRNYVNVLFWAMGKVTRWTGSNEARVYSIARVLLGGLLLWLLWKFAGRLFDAPLLRLSAFALFVVQGGWAGVADVFERHWDFGHVSSPEWWTPEMNTLFSMMLFPHFLAGFCCMIGIALLALAAWKAETPRRRIALAASAGGVMTVLTFFHPYDVVPMVATLWSGAALVGWVERRWPRAELSTAMWASAVWFPSLVYNYWVFSQNPAMRAWDLQNEMITPEPTRLVISLGIGGVLAALALLYVRRMSLPLLFTAAWFVSQLVLIHLPVRFQRRMIGGIQFPMGALATFALAYLLAPVMLRALSRWKRAIAWRGAFGAAPLGAAVLAVCGLILPFELAGPRRIVQLEWNAMRTERYPAWIRKTEEHAFEALDKLRLADGVVFCSYEMGGLVPPTTDLRTYLGHYALTIDAQRKKAEIARFFGTDDPAEDAWRLRLLAHMKATHLLHTQHERKLGPFDPATRPWLKEIYQAGGKRPTRAVVYEIDPAAFASASPSP